MFAGGSGEWNSLAASQVSLLWPPPPQVPFETMHCRDIVQDERLQGLCPNVCNGFRGGALQMPQLQQQGADC